MRVELLYLDGCPHWRLAQDRLRQALLLTGRPEVAVRLREVTTVVEAAERRFSGSPTILVDGSDPFDTGGSDRPSMTCRLYPTPEGLQGSPTVAQLRAALQ